MDDDIIVKYVKVDGLLIQDPLPKFEYEAKTGLWTIVIEAGDYADFFASRRDREVEVEIGMQLGTVLDVGKVRTWSGQVADVPTFIAKIHGQEPMSYVER
jgi:hypothetical protein